MRADKKMSFHKSEQVEGQFQEFPNADNITRRLKKLVQIIGKPEYQSVSFDRVQSTQEPTGLTLAEKNLICDLLINEGIPVGTDGKNDYGYLRGQLSSLEPMKASERENSHVTERKPQELVEESKIEKRESVQVDNEDMQDENPEDNDEQKPALLGVDDAAKEAEKIMLQNIERFIQRIRMISQQIIQDASSKDQQAPANIDEGVLITTEEKPEEGDKIISFDPDEDGFEFGIDKAQALHKTINILQFIRKNLSPNNFKHFDAGVEQLQEQFKLARSDAISNLEETKSDQTGFNPQYEDKLQLNQTKQSSQLLPENWSCSKHDKTLLKLVSEKGFNGLSLLSGNKDLGFEGITISPELAQKRIEEICEFFKDFQQQSKVVKKPKKEMILAAHHHHHHLSLGSNPNIFSSHKVLIFWNKTISKSIILQLCHNPPGDFIGGLREPPTQRVRMQQMPSAPRMKIPKAAETSDGQFAEPKKKQPKMLMQRDEQGNVIYPIQINSSLKILDLGVIYILILNLTNFSFNMQYAHSLFSLFEIEFQKPQYHTEKNLFPIGFKSLREHNSQLTPGQRCDYLCEIMDGGSKPMFRVTPMDDQENPITKDSSTGCWIENRKFWGDQYVQK